MKIILSILLVVITHSCFGQTQNDSVIVTSRTGEAIRYVYPTSYVTADQSDSIITRNTATRKKGLLSITALKGFMSLTNISGTWADSSRANIYGAINVKQTIPVAGQGIGGTVTQATSKSTGVTINKQYGQITMNNAALAAAAEVSFTVTNSTVSASDVVLVSIQSVGTAGSYFVTVGAVANGSFAVTVGNVSAGPLSQALVLNFAVIKSVIN